MTTCHFCENAAALVKRFYPISILPFPVRNPRLEESLVKLAATRSACMGEVGVKVERHRKHKERERGREGGLLRMPNALRTLCTA